MYSKGRLVSIEGLPGSGKTTQSHRLAARLQADGLSVAYLPDLASFSGDGISQKIMHLFCSSGDQFMRHGDVLIESFLAAAIKVSEVEEVIRKALESHDVVIEDRGCHTMYAYGLGSFEQYYRVDRDHALEWLQAIDGLGGIRPDLTIYLRCSLGKAINRAEARDAKPFTAEQRAYLAHVGAAYEFLLSQDDHIVEMDAEKGPEEIARSLYEAVRAGLPELAK